MTLNLVIQTDFGLGDGAVSAMYGVALSVDPHLKIYDLTHEIPPFNIWEASYRLFQTVPYWPEKTVFVSVIDPGVGSDRLSIAVKTKQNQIIITPDNGTLTHIIHSVGISEARIIDEKLNRLPESGESFTFHGRDIYAYTGARLAANSLQFSDVGPQIHVNDLIKLEKSEAFLNNGVISGIIDIHDVRFGNLWTNIDRKLFKSLYAEYGDLLKVTIVHNGLEKFKNGMTFGRSFADSKYGEPLLYVNSVDKIGIALNQGSFAKAYQIGTGINWKVYIRKSDW